MVGFLLTYGVHSSIYVSSRVEVDGGVFTYIWSTLFYLCQLQDGGRWWGFYLHMEYTLLCQLQGGGRWWGFYLHMEYTLLSMSAPGWR